MCPGRRCQLPKQHLKLFSRGKTISLQWLERGDKDEDAKKVNSAVAGASGLFRLRGSGIERTLSSLRGGSSVWPDLRPRKRIE